MNVPNDLLLDPDWNEEDFLEDFETFPLMDLSDEEFEIEVEEAFKESEEKIRECLSRNKP